MAWLCWYNPLTGLHSAAATVIFAPDKWFGAFLYQKNWCLQQFLSPKPCFLAKKVPCTKRQAKKTFLFILLFLNHCYFQLFHAFIPYQGHFLNLHFSKKLRSVSADVVRARLLAHKYFSYFCVTYILNIKQVFLPRESLKPFMLIKISADDCQKWGNWVLKRHLTIFSFAIKRKSRKRERFVEISANTYFRLWSESLSKVNISICKIQQRKERQVLLLSCQILHQLQYSRYKSLSTDFLISSQHNRLQSYHNMKAVTV